MFILLSSTWIGALSFIVFFGALVIGIFLMWTKPGDRFKAYMKELFTPPPPPQKIDPHSRPHPKVVSCKGGKTIIEMDPYKPPKKSPDPNKVEYIRSNRACPRCGERVICDPITLEDGDVWYDSTYYILHALRVHRDIYKDPHAIPCHCCRLLDYWIDDPRYSISPPNPYCGHCGGTGLEPVMVNITADGKRIVSCARVVLSDDDLLICPICRNGQESRLKCEVCGRTGALTRREIHELGYWAPGRKNR